MFARLIITVVISSFWLVMTALYIRVQFFPNYQPGWFHIPVPHVLNLVFNSEQSSTLAIYQGEYRIGTVYVRPLLDESNDVTSYIMVNGEVTIKLPGVRKRVTFRNKMGFIDNYQSVAEFESGIRMKNPEFELEIESAAGSEAITYRVSGANDTTLREGSGTVPEILAASPLGEAGISLDALQQVAATPAQPTARRATTQLASQEIEVYRISIPVDASSYLEIDVSQLGRVVGVRTPYGIKLVSEGVDL